MATARLYYGSGLAAIDRKGRVAIPNQLRALVVEHGGGTQIGLMPSPRRDCLSAFDLDYIALLPGLIERAWAERDPADAAITRELLASETYANIERLPFDTSGRFVISQQMRDFGELDELAFFHGSGEVIDIWNPARALDEPTIAAKTKIALENALKRMGGE